VARVDVIQGTPAPPPREFVLTMNEAEAKHLEGLLTKAWWRLAPDTSEEKKVDAVRVPLRLALFPLEHT